MPNQREQLNEMLSALMDGEASELEVMRLLKAVESDDALRASWMRYQLVASMVRKQAVQHPLISLELADRVVSSLQVSPESDSSWHRSVVRLAIAASVALVVVTTVHWQQSRQSGQVLTASASVPAKLEQSPFSQQHQIDRQTPPSSLLASQPLTNSQLKTYQKEQLERYMQDHTDQGAVEPPRVMAPLAVNKGK
jgi:sigma-E factor negative regulatory protein RseA